MQRILASLLVALAALLAPLAPARAGGEEAKLLRVPWNVTEHRLANGMRALLLPDHRAPMVVFQVWYGVGSREEVPGKTGLAHLLEHMMFRGTKKYGPKMFSKIVKRNGGTHNAFTSFDYTAYFERIAADRLALVMELEADRMMNLDLKKSEFDPERQVVLEERRLRTEDSPTGLLFEQLRRAAYTAHPYGNPIIGWSEDIRALTVKDLEAFYRRYYRPANAIAVIVGDFRPEEAIRLLEKHFGPLPASPPFPGRPVLHEPPQRAERRVIVRKEAQLPYMATAHHTPNWRSPDAAALIMLENILSGGETSRLYQRLVRKDAIALEAGADYTFISVGPTLFYLYGRPAPGKTVAQVERVIREEVDRLVREGVPAEELARALRNVEAQTVFAMDSYFYRAMLLGRSAVAGDWRMLQNYLPSLAEVTSEDIVRVAKKYLDPKRRTTAELVPLPTRGRGRPLPSTGPNQAISEGGR